MEKVITVAQVIVPIFVAVLLGVIAKRRKLMTPEQVADTPASYTGQYLKKILAR